MDLRPSARAIVRLAIGLLLASAAAAVWEVLARQSPTSAWHVGLLPGPVAELRDTATTLALASFAAAWLIPWAAPVKEPWIWVGALHFGAILSVVALTYGATTGMYGVQIDDPRPDSEWLFQARALGGIVLMGCLLDFARRLFVGRRAARTSAEAPAAAARPQAPARGDESAGSGE